MTTSCLCGSGKDIKECHGTDFSRQQIRNIIKYDILKLEKNKKILIGAHYKTRPFEKKTFDCVVKFLKPTTPAGTIIYPHLIINDSKAIRPITIDGNHFIENKGDIIQSVFCMLTPISWGTITFNMSNVKLTKNIFFEVKAKLSCDGDPFTSVFALHYKDSLIKLYHHTSSSNRDLIIKGNTLNGSKWNMQGTNELKYTHYIYTTNIDSIDDSFDLLEIGMARHGTSVMLQTDDGSITEEFIVYREEPENRDAKIVVWVEPEMVAPNPLILHEPQNGDSLDFSWWEVFDYSIFRVPIRVNGHLPIEEIGNTSEYKLIQNENFQPLFTFLAGHGMDMISMLRILSEDHIDDMSREGGHSKADLGHPDPLWISTWEKNLSFVTGNILKEIKL